VIYPTICHLVSMKGTGTNGSADIKGAKRISTGAAGERQRVLGGRHMEAAGP